MCAKIKLEFIRKLNDYGKVFISSENKLDVCSKRYAVQLAPEKMHDLLYYATMCISEGAVSYTHLTLPTKA